MTPPPRSVLALALHSLTLTSLVLAQPILSVFEASPEFFIARATRPIDLVVFALSLIIVPSLIISAIVGIATRGRPLWLAKASATIVGMFGSLFVLQLIARLPLVPWYASVATALLGGVTIGLLYWKRPALDSFLRVLSPAPVVVLAFFLFTPPISQLIFPSLGGVSGGPVLSSAAPVVFIVLDEFPEVSLLNGDQTIDRLRYPNISALADTATWFRNAAPAHPYTTKSLLALLSGELAEPGEAPNASDFPQSVFTLFSNTHQVHSFEPLTEICPRSICEREAEPLSSMSIYIEVTDLALNSVEMLKRIVMPQLFSESSFSVDDPFGLDAARRESIGSQIDADHVSEFQEFLGRIDGSDGQFYFGHFLLPHAPFHYLPSGRSYNRESQVIPALDDRGYWSGDPWDVLDNQQRHLLQVQFVDSLIGQLIERLRNLDAFDRTMIVLTSDHGVSHIQGDARRDVTQGTLYDVGLVPLIVKAPGQHLGVVDDRLVQAVDVLPTMADLMGSDMPWDGDGISLIGGPGRERLFMRDQDYEDVEIDVQGPGRSLAIERLLDTFGAGTQGIFAFGPFADLVGREVSDLRVGSSVLSAKIDDPEAYSAVRLDSGFVPAFAAGQVSGLDLLPVEPQIALVLNGVVGAVVPLHAIDGDGARFGGVIKDDSFADGANTLSLLSVYSQGGATVVNRVSSDATPGYVLDRSSGETETIDSTDGEVFAIDETAVRGFVDSGHRSKVDTVMGGWAVDAATLEPVELVLVFSQGRFLWSVSPTRERAGLVDEFGSESVRMSGFELIIPVASSGPLPSVEVFGVSRGKASRLTVLESVIQDLSIEG